ncbi:MAG: YicC family protein [Bacteroidia bacterium]|nr:YicC family protein [Bacteroidia bacterium]NNC86501.1 YicC family protein [Bacteroidia bacterium]NNM16073.1 YicC family protein [Bacteroidia bacterium]
MIKSMTGYGKASGEVNGNRVSIEIKSLNSKFLECNVRLPQAYRSKEMDIRNLISTELSRGKVELSSNVEFSGTKSTNFLNKPLIQAYHKEFQTLGESGIVSNDYLGLIMRLPNVMNLESEELDKESWNALKGIIADALKKVNGFRDVEGKSLDTDMNSRITSIDKYLKEVEEIDGSRAGRIKDKLQGQVKQIEQLNFDENRFEQELIYYLEKLDISEEKLRLKTHLDYFKEVLSGKESNGKKLGFITQEIGREINTIGSKANDAEIQRLVVGMKDDLEKIKEQVANVL